MTDYGDVLDARTVRVERAFPGSAEQLWAYLIDPAKRARWLAGGALEARAGGRFALEFDHAKLSSEHQAPEKYADLSGARLEGSVLECDPPRRLTLTWAGHGNDSRVTFELKPQGDRVRLVITHSRVEPTELVEVGAGWHAHSGILQDVLESRAPRGFWSAHEAAEQELTRRLPALEEYFAWSGAVGRSVHAQGETWSSLTERRLDAPIDRVWRAFTDPETLKLWFGIASGALELGGEVELDLFMPEKTKLKVLACEAPHRLRTTWQYGNMAASEVELRLLADGSGTHLQLEHFMAPSRVDARGTGSGWEVAVYHLDAWLNERPRPSTVMHPAMDHVWTHVGE